MPIQNPKSPDQSGGNKKQNLICANCGIPVRWQPTMVDGKAYCCLGCAAGGPCECDYDHLPMPGDRVSIVVRREQFVHQVDMEQASWIYKSERFEITRREE